ncbi:MAG TPA: amidohydrolase/deacetylase family metallohydrolase, partial [Acidobacteriota bacterium]|nr:amidohydrolase/deacetylase family metallohydrolase [Acidobacteriota bacterium]
MPFGVPETSIVRWAASLVGSLIVLSLTGLQLLAADPPYEIVIKGGQVIDPKNGINQVMDVAIAGGKIVSVASNIPPEQAKKTISAEGLYVVPGLIDLHAHVFFGTDPHAQYAGGLNSVSPDGFTFRAGVTTVVDVGGAGWRNFQTFKEQVIDHSRTRVLAFLNIVGSGMAGNPAEQDLADMNPRLTALKIRQYRDLIVGVKVAHYTGPEWDPIDRLVEAGRLANVPVMVDFGSHIPNLSLKTLLLDKLRSGDIYTHMYGGSEGREAIVDETGKLKPYVLEARNRGVIFDVGHGGGSLFYQFLLPSIQQAFWPDVISTDLHRGSMNAGMKDMLNVMSKFLSLGMSLQDVIRASSWTPAQVIKRTDLGHLDIGSSADVAVLRLHRGNYGFV